MTFDKVPSNLEIAVNGGQLAYMLRGLLGDELRIQSLTIKRLAIELLNEVLDNLCS